jgi:putative endonuclease
MQMRYVYLITSIPYPDQRHVGSTTDFKQRMEDHNAGRSPHTSKYKPWRPVVVLPFDNDRKAEAFERYLKQGSGHAFANRHFW